MTPGLKFRLDMESPMLAKLIKHLKNSEITSIYESKNWVFDTKHNGLRMTVHNTFGNYMECFSRNESVTDFLPVSYGHKMYWGEKPVFPTRTFVIDCEVVSSNPNIVSKLGNLATETELQAIAALLALNTEESLAIQKELKCLKFMVFDCLAFHHENLMDQPFSKRRKAARKVVEELQELGFPFEISKCVQKNKVEFLEQIWSSGGEGVVAKRLDGKYIPRPSRPRNGWIKIKRDTTGILGDPIDGYITGYELGKEGKGFENLVGSLHVSLNLIKQDGSVTTHHIARVINIPLVDRKRITVKDGDGHPCLDENYYSRVVEVEGQAISARAKRLTHPRIVRWRDDKSPHDCEMYEKDLLAMIV